MELVLDPSSSGEAGIPAGYELLEFANAVEWQTADLADARLAVLEAVGADGLWEAAGTIAIFNGLIRVADGTGIQLDHGLKEASIDDREDFDLNSYTGAVNTPGAEVGPDYNLPEPPPVTNVQELFS